MASSPAKQVTQQVQDTAQEQYTTQETEGPKRNRRAPACDQKARGWAHQFVLSLTLIMADSEVLTAVKALQA
ncbi:hypothetical protein L484_008450 [Morus notabilis]|uniref:Uncharacterized protein n=1 Tax=Morus notabilis TaxID=981085 RepID=W9RYA6_9ROSA|nr:hypothetical protein L484_008450 [Morus notabilis]